MDTPLVDDNKLSVLYITENGDAGKEGTLAHDTFVSYSALVDMLYTVVFTRYGQGEKAKRIGQNLWIYSTNDFGFIHRFWVIFGVVRRQITWKFKLQANLIVAETPYMSGLFAYFVAKRHKKRLVVRVGNDFLDPYWKRASFKNLIKHRIAKIVVREATWIEAASEKIKKSIEAFDPTLLGRVSVVLPFVDVDKIAALPITVDIRKKYPQFGFIILLVSQLSRDKEVDLSLHVLRALIRRYPRTGLVIVGGGSDKARLRRMSSRFGISQNVIFEAPTPDIYSYYKTANISLITSRYEDHALQLLESLACSCPVVTTPVGLATELLSMPPYSDFVCPVGDADCFFEQMRRVMEVSGLREDFKVNAKFIVGEKFGYTREKYLDNVKTVWMEAFGVK